MTFLVLINHYHIYAIIIISIDCSGSVIINGSRYSVQYVYYECKLMFIMNATWFLHFQCLRAYVGKQNHLLSVRLQSFLTI